MQKAKRVLALLGVIILASAMLTVTIMLFFSKHFSDEVFRGLLTCLIALPIVAFGYSILLKWGTSFKNSLPSEDELDNIDQ